MDDYRFYFEIVKFGLQAVVVPVAYFLHCIDKKVAIMKNDIGHIKENCIYHQSKGGD